ncbi:GNAT family N-acetyltransferase [Alteribacter keqinensis]|uniref:GNAT family N-acetyltransferase n=1 Tax=Alteribacter keqinensis TaxID=2483800 RepID=A0A3M7TQ05_9BACI|nr:GNAT family N-acetyltransferase [Alteribacter keqinensis]RNA67638.1 GNAT family N-acetyltransferase [Alteribacter keqinensis]
MEKVTIKRMDDFERDVREEAAAVFIDGYYKDLSFFSKDRTTLQKAIRHAFCEDVYYLAEWEGEVVGILACSTNQSRAMKVNKREIVDALGFLKGSFAYSMLSRELHPPLHYPDDTGYIECVATTSESRGKGVASALVNHVIDHLHFSTYILEVVDTNTNAHRLYKKLGFTEYKRKKERFGKMKGFRERIYMRFEC